MMINDKQQEKIAAAITADRAHYRSDAQHAKVLDISTSVYSEVKNGNTSQKMSDGKWISIARKLGVNLGNSIEWKAAKTATFEYITTKLDACRQSSLSAILCDLPNIGKTFTALYYAKGHKNTVYIDCSQYKTKQRLIRTIAQSFGVDNKGRYVDVYDDLVYYLRAIEKPLIILDEAGDLHYEAFLELKALWNATERCCGWFMMGADGLAEKINRSIDCKKVGYTEMFSRYGDKYAKVTPNDAESRKLFLSEQVRVVAELNAPANINVGDIVRQSAGSLRSLYTKLEVIKRV